jgi:hypothetical protein
MIMNVAERSAATREAALARLDLDAGVEVGC